jgi:hypothetical protein
MRLTKLLITSLITLLAACGDLSMPTYWSCTGSGTQLVMNAYGNTIERYAGQDNLFIEIYRQSVSQFSAPTTFGVYALCINSDKEIVFSYPKCPGAEEGSEEDSESYKRLGSLNKQSGVLIFDESRTLNDLKIISSGIYECHLLGRRYSYEDMKPADAI